MIMTKRQSMAISPKDLITGSIKTSSLPEIFIMLSEMLNDPTSSFSDIAKVISMDTALAARILRIVNSSFYSFPSNVETVTHAISIIGTQQLHDLALATTILTIFQGVPEDLVNMNRFWRHSLGCAITARILAIHGQETNPERFYLCGILHDVGRLIIMENLPDQAREIIDRHQEEGGLMVDMEQKVLGFNHAEVGASLAKAWKLPLSYEEIIACHHQPSKARRYPVESAIVNLADIFSKAMELGSSGDPFVPPLDVKSWDHVGLNPNVLESIWNQIEIQYSENIEIVLAGR